MTTNDNAFISVIIQYRLGAFGFLSSDDVKANGAPNAGLLDMEFALQWVQAHIGKFGGDPRRVTIAGESAGAGAVMYQAMAYGGAKESSLFQNVGHLICGSKEVKHLQVEDYRRKSVGPKPIPLQRRSPKESLRRFHQCGRLQPGLFAPPMSPLRQHVGPAKCQLRRVRSGPMGHLRVSNSRVQSALLGITDFVPATVVSSPSQMAHSSETFPLPNYSLALPL
jgi:hypothetical protein